MMPLFKERPHCAGFIQSALSQTTAAVSEAMVVVLHPCPTTTITLLPTVEDSIREYLLHTAAKGINDDTPPR